MHFGGRCLLRLIQTFLVLLLVSGVGTKDVSTGVQPGVETDLVDIDRNAVVDDVGLEASGGSLLRDEVAACPPVRVVVTVDGA